MPIKTSIYKQLIDSGKYRTVVKLPRWCNNNGKTRSTPMSEETKKKIGALGNYEAHRRRKKSLDENL